ncbi:hypothetical protein HUJ05_007910 [Dendroctonus ponderosae]|nr:hypothetical protein HUJ05_007910 [Dendroctonus ponderosae]
MAQLFTQEIFELKPLVKSIDLKLCTENRNGVKHILALITCDNEIVLYYSYGDLSPVVKIIPWFSDSSKSIQATCLDPTATWLLITCLDSSLYIVPALHIVDKKQKIDCKWSLTDVTAFPKTSNLPNLPTCCVWWQTLESNQNALIGFDTGQILVVSLTDGRVLGGCHVTEPVVKLYISVDNVKDIVSLLISCKSGKEWQLILEHHSNGYTWPVETTNVHPDASMKSKFYNLKQLGVDKLVSLRQRLAPRKDSQTDSTNESSFYSELYFSTSTSESFADSQLLGQSAASADLNSWNSNSLKSHEDSQSNLELQLIPLFSDTNFHPQNCRNRSFFSALHKPSGLLTVHSEDIEKTLVHLFKVPPRTDSVIMTDNLIYTLNRDINVISIISRQLAETRLDGETAFNEDSLVAQFMIDNEEIIAFFKIMDMSVDVAPSKNKYKKNQCLYSTDISFLKQAIDTCMVVTTKNVYKIFVRYSPVKRFIKYVIEENDLEKAEKLSYIFAFNLQQLLEYCGDLMISQRSYHSGIILYKQAKVHLLKRVLKLAVSADCKTLLKFVHLCLSASRIDMNITTRIHIGNVAVMAYVELLLRSNSNEQVKANHTTDFMDFLVHESHFDPILAVNMTCQAGHWNIVSLLSKSRGLQFETVVAFSKILQNDLSPNPSNLDFLYALSEPTLTQSFLVLPRSAQASYDFCSFEILKRLVIQLDPSQPCAMAFLRAIYQNDKDSSGTDSNIDSFDYEAVDGCTTVMKDLVETFLFVILSLTARLGAISFDLGLLETTVPVTKQKEEKTINRLPDLQVLSCGYEHAAVIRNNCVYTMGVNAAGCLGTGPMLTNTSGPRLVNTLQDLKVTALSVSCGRKHTLCATDWGVFAWGSNSHGQLGLGPHLQETPYPQLISAISQLKIVDISAGQYHNLALTHSGKVYSWGWGIHGQLGHGCCDNEYYPKLVKFDSPVKQVAAGHAHSIILTCDGKVYGFGSNVFGQLESNSRQIDSKKCTKPTWVVIMPDIYVPVEKIVTSYFHNMAVTADQKVFMWGASPEEMRFYQQRNNSKNAELSESWKSSIEMYESKARIPIKEISVGYRHCAILDKGRIFWGKNKDEELTEPNVKDPYEDIIGHKFDHVSCGLDYTMAIEQNGQVFAWGTPAMIETILGIPGDAIRRKKSDERMIMFKGTKRSFKTPYVHPISNNLPIEISVLPSIVFTFNGKNYNCLFRTSPLPHQVLLPDNDPAEFYDRQKSIGRLDFSHIYHVPKVTVTEKTIHYALRIYLELYDIENVQMKSLELSNFQVASKVSFLNGNFVDSLGFTIEAFKRHIVKYDVDLPSLFTCKDSYDVTEKDQGIELIVESLKTELDREMSSNLSSPARALSSSSSLDSLRQFGEEGGQESPCEIDIRQNITNYLHSVNKGASSPTATPKLNESYKDILMEKSVKQHELQIKNKQAKEVLDLASHIVEFYIEKVYISENHILMQNILLKCIEFWLSNNLPIVILENILLKNLDKYFYPLSILLFCKNFDVEDVILPKDGEILQISSSRFLKEFSTKFCLHLCSMVLENANKS